MRILLFLILPLFLITGGSAYSQNGKCHRSTEGKEFWFGFMEGRNDNGNVHYIEITVTARQTTNFSVFIGKSAVAFDSRTVTANSSVQIPIPLNLAEATGSETIQEKAIHLVAENPVNVYALNWDKNSADVAVMYPVESLGNEYFTMCYTPNVDNRPAHGKNSEFLIVASKDTTIVEIVPSVVTDNGKPANVPFTVTLHKGEVYQVQSLNQRNLSGQGDLTGSYIKSDKPVALYSGNFSTTIPVESNMTGFDHLYEQIPPVQTWGREYYAVPLRTRMSDAYRVMASEDNTTILIGTRSPINLDRGEYYEFTLQSDEPTRIFADNPILVAQFSQSNKTDDYYTGGNGDPFMIILSSVSQSKNEVTFVAYNSTQINDYYVNIVVLTSEEENIVLDGDNVGSLFKPFKGTDYSYTQIKLHSGTHNLKNLNPDRGFLAYVYGYGGNESYGYGVGFNLNLVLDLGQSINFQGDTLRICETDEIVLDAGPYFDNYLWNTGDTTQKITVTKQDYYWAQGTTVDGCTQSDSLYIWIKPLEKPDIGEDSTGCALKLMLDAGGGYASYEWNTGDTTQIIEANKTNQYRVTVYDDFGCSARDTMNLTVFTSGIKIMDDYAVTEKNKSVIIKLIYNDLIEIGSIDISTLAVTIKPRNGYVAINTVNGEITYTPNWNFTGVDTLKYKICDDGIPCNPECGEAFVFISVNAINSSSPVANDDYFKNSKNFILMGNLIWNDSEPDGDNIEINTNPLESPKHGKVIIETDGTFSYTPNEEYFGLDSFKYVICDSGTPSFCDSATVYIDITTNVEPNSLNDTWCNIFPNPNDGIFNIEIFGMTETDINVEVLNVYGSFIKKYQLGKSTGFILQSINLQGLTRGVYYVKIISGKNKVTKEVIIQ